MYRRNAYKKAARLLIAKNIRREKRVYQFGRCKGNWFDLRTNAIAFYKSMFTLTTPSLIQQLAEHSRQYPSLNTRTLNMRRY